MERNLERKRVVLMAPMKEHKTVESLADLLEYWRADWTVKMSEMMSALHMAAEMVAWKVRKREHSLVVHLEHLKAVVKVQ